MIALLRRARGGVQMTKHLSSSRHEGRWAIVGALSAALSIGACDAPPDRSQPAEETSLSRRQGDTQAKKQGDAQAKKSPGTKKKDSSKQKSFTISAGSVTVERVGFDTLRIARVTANSGWRRHVEDDFDDNVGVEFLGRGRTVDFNASLENGRLQAESCVNISRLSDRPAIQEAGMVALQRIGDEDLHVSIVKSSQGWQPRITDNNSEDIEVLFVSGKGRIEFDAQLDDGRLEGSICEVLT